MRRRVRALLVALAGMFGVEAGLRVLVGIEVLTFPHEQPWRRQPVPGERGARGETRQDAPYAWTSGYDASGLREGGRLAGDVSGAILAVGDSWIFGHVANDGDTLPDQLEALLGVQVYNAGQPGAAAPVLVRRAREQLQRLRGVTGVLIGQPHNPRIADPGRPPAVPPIATYRLLRLWLAPYTWDRPPRGNADIVLEEVEVIAGLVAELRALGLKVWFALFPQERASAVRGRFGPEPEWTTLDVPMGGHGLAERACWSFEDHLHPSAAGYRAIAEALVPVIREDRRQTTWSTEPSCADVPGAGPGKPGWEWED